MKINYTKMKTRNFFMLTDNKKPEKLEDVKKMLMACAENLKKAQAKRETNTLGELWAVESLEDLIECME